MPGLSLSRSPESRARRSKKNDDETTPRRSRTSPILPASAPRGMRTVERFVEASPLNGWKSETTNQIAAAASSSARTARIRTSQRPPRRGGGGGGGDWGRRGSDGRDGGGGSWWPSSASSSSRNDSPPSGSSASGISAVACGSGRATRGSSG